MARIPRFVSAVAGLVAGGLAIGTWELAAGLVAGIPSPVTAIGSFVIALQPPGAKQVVVDLFGTADKLALNLLVLVVALGLGLGIGLMSRRSLRAAQVAFAFVAAFAFAVSLRDPLVNPVGAALVAAAAALVAGTALSVLLRAAMIAQPAAVPTAEMPDWSRRRFLGSSMALGVAAVASGALGRTLLQARANRAASVPVSIPPAVGTVPPDPASASLDVAGISPAVTPNASFYRIDTKLLTPQLDASTWKLTVTGMVDRELSFSYADLLAMPLHEEYVTIACVSNEVGGNLVGNARWRGVRLQEILDRAGVHPDATQVVGRSFDGWTCGFPTAWLANVKPDALVAVAMNGQPLPPEHGFPARLIVPGLYGYVSATKWLTNIELTTLEAFNAYWVPLGWSKEAPMKTASRIDVPRGNASLDAGTVPVAGVAWAGERGVSKVQLQVDDGPWTDADLSTPLSQATWVQWLVRWQASAGTHRLRVRAVDGTGTIQDETPHEPPPNGATGYHTISVQVS
jgi:DMSO/TMAO reductase YedYZ molybdopterin-dependent catalytic subunit